MYLRRDAHEVLTASDGVEGLRIARESQPGLVILDLMLPGLDGIEVARALRQESDVPIIMLTARVEEEERLSGLEVGADDYVTKPFSPRELAARVKAVLRRAADPQEQGPAQIEHGDVTVNFRYRSVLVGGQPVGLTPTEFRILALMIREPGRVFTRDQIIDRAFGYDFEEFDRTVDAHVSSLRRKLASAAGNQSHIHTVYGVGYRFGQAGQSLAEPANAKQAQSKPGMSEQNLSKQPKAELPKNERIFLQPPVPVGARVRRGVGPVPRTPAEKYPDLGCPDILGKRFNKWVWEVEDAGSTVGATRAAGSGSPVPGLCGPGLLLWLPGLPAGTAISRRRVRRAILPRQWPG